MDRQAYQVGIRYLTVAGQTSLDILKSVRDRDRVWPKAMTGKIQIELQYAKCIGWRQRVDLKRWVAENPHEGRLREWTSCPSAPGMACEPSSDFLVEHVLRPRQCDEYVGIQQ